MSLDDVPQAGELTMLTYHQSVRLQVDNVLVQYHIFDADEPLMVTFPPGCQVMSQEQVDEQKSAWSFQFFAKQKMNVISFNHIGDDNYFDSLAFEQFLVKLSSAIAVFSSRIGYGASRGGFATALHADKLNLTKALLLMPLSTYWQALAPWDPKLKNHSQSQKRDISHLDVSQCKTPLTIIYDPLFFPDRQHKQRFENCVASYTVPGVGHRIVRALQDLGSLKSTVLEFRVGEINAARFYQAARKRRTLSYYFRTHQKVCFKKSSLKRYSIIQLHKLYLVSQQSINLQKMIDRLKESCAKRQNSICSFIHGKDMMFIRNTTAGSVLVFC